MDFALSSACNTAAVAPPRGEKWTCQEGIGLVVCCALAKKEQPRMQMRKRVLKDRLVITRLLLSAVLGKWSS